VVSKALHQASSFLLVNDKNRCTQRLVTHSNRLG